MEHDPEEKSKGVGGKFPLSVNEGLAKEVSSELRPEPSLQRHAGRETSNCMSVRALTTVVRFRFGKADLEQSGRPRRGRLCVQAQIAFLLIQVPAQPGINHPPLHTYICI